MSKVMNDKDFIGNRAMNDYTANNPTNKQDKNWKEPEHKSVICIFTDFPMDVHKIKKNK